MSLALSSPLQIIYRPPIELKSDPRNPRSHSKRQIRQIAKSIETFGFNAAILTDDNDIVMAAWTRLCCSTWLKSRRFRCLLLANISAKHAWKRITG